MSVDVVKQSRAVLSTHARSFRWASRFLPASRRDDASVVYAFCRLVDDLADEATDEEAARIDLDVLEREVRGTSRARPLVLAYLDVAYRRNIDVRSALELIAGVRSDLGTVRVKTDAELMRYCYRVAGTVGLMMCGVLDVSEQGAHPHAIDLGVAMQLTNICRDVLEDAGRGRVYLPERRLREAGTSSGEILSGEADHASVASVVRELLELADAYYLSADRGMRYIPRRSRFAIVVASRLYRGIGVKLYRSRGGDALAGRTWVSGPGKAVLVAQSLVHFASPSMMGFGSGKPHDPRLHHALEGLPGSSC